MDNGVFVSCTSTITTLALLTWLITVRQIATGFLFPLWDARGQTLADKIMSTVCLPIQ